MDDNEFNKAAHEQSNLPEVAQINATAFLAQLKEFDISIKGIAGGLELLETNIVALAKRRCQEKPSPNDFKNLFTCLDLTKFCCELAQRHFSLISETADSLVEQK